MSRDFFKYRETVKACQEKGLIFVPGHKSSPREGMLSADSGKKARKELCALLEKGPVNATTAGEALFADNHNPAEKARYHLKKMVDEGTVRKDSYGGYHLVR